MDGERNLKPRYPAGAHGLVTDYKDFQIFEQNDENVHEFAATCADQDVGIESFCPGGSMIRCQGKVYALVVYTGKETKQALNKGEYKFKLSSTSYRINVVMIVSLVILVVATLMMSQIGNRTWTKANTDKSKNNAHVYIYPEIESKAGVNYENYAWQSAISMFLVFARILPLDMAIVIQLSRIAYTFLHMENDLEMANENEWGPDGEL
jgi:magnesium-transporting ATPase (P-type)